jgi:hypothetical protein
MDKDLLLNTETAAFYLFMKLILPCTYMGKSSPQTREYCTIRLAMATFWRTFHHGGKFSPAQDGGCTPFLIHSIYHHEQSSRACRLHLIEQKRSFYFSSTLFSSVVNPSSPLPPPPINEVIWSSGKKSRKISMQCKICEYF